MYLLKVISTEIAFNAVTLKIDILNPAGFHIIFNSLTCRGSVAWEPVCSRDNSFFTLFKSCGLHPVCGKFVRLTDPSVLFWLLLGVSKQRWKIHPSHQELAPALGRLQPQQEVVMTVTGKAINQILLCTRFLGETPRFL